MIVEIDYFTILVVFSKKYSLSEFRKAAKVKSGSYADVLVNRIYRCLFVSTKNLIDEYEKYYKIEYPDFSKFLFLRYKIDLKLAEDLSAKLNRRTFIGYGRDNISMFSDETFSRALEKILVKLGEKKHENKN